MLTSCSKEEGCTDITAINYNPSAELENGTCNYQLINNPIISVPVIDVTRNITSNTTWTKNNIYAINGRIFVESGVTLTIEPGTIIKGEAGTKTNAKILIIAKGAKIDAKGTALEPIIFTSINDQIQPGEIESNLGGLSIESSISRGQWGGLILLGDAPVSSKNGGASDNIEGLPGDESLATYGGSNPNDNSGFLQYVSIRFGGIEIAPGNEINGLTLGGVGNGTTIDHIEVLGNLDDGIEFFGGTVDLSDAVVYKQGDDAIDMDQSYSGTVSNVMVVLDETSSNHAFEIDGPEDSGVNADGKFTVDGAYVIGNGSLKMAQLKSAAQGTFKNVFFTDFTEVSNNFIIDGDGANNNFSNTDLTVTNNIFDITGEIPTIVSKTSTTELDDTNKKADVSEGNIDVNQFTEWTQTYQLGAFNALK
jgi:hypothetical protein